MPMLALLTSLVIASQAFPWPGWGGPSGNFRVADVELSESWPEEGPTRMWEHSLGEGYSSFACDGPRLFTMTRVEDQEVAVCLDRQTGETIWESSWVAPFEADMNVEHGPGPHSSPVLHDEWVVFVGITVKVRALDRITGDLVWERDLRKELGATHLKRGYCASPIVVDDNVIIPISGKGQSMIALAVQSGETVWNRGSFNWCYSTPTLIRWKDRAEVVVFSDESVEGFHPLTGEELWRVAHPTPMRVNVCSPIFEGGLLFVSSAYGEGSRGIRLSREGDGTEAEELWHERRLQIHHGNAVRVGDWIYGASGHGPALLTCLHTETGELAWRERDIGKCTLLEADGKLIVLEEDGALSLLKVNPKRLEVLDSTKLFEGRSWTVPVLIGTTLIARDRKKVVALDLSRSS